MEKSVKKSNKKYFIFPIMLIAIFSVFAASFLYSPEVSQNSDTITYHSNVCVYKNGELVQCDHNLLYDSGKDQIKFILGSGAAMAAIKNISLCNATAGCAAPVAAGNEAFNTYANCGLVSDGGTYSSIGTGNWSIYKTFTATCDNVLTNSTRIGNSTGSAFAGNTFALVTLQTNDQLSINWTISVT